MKYQIGRIDGAVVDWETTRLEEGAMVAALMDKLNLTKGLAKGSVNEAQKRGDRGVFVSKTHKIRGVK